MREFEKNGKKVRKNNLKKSETSKVEKMRFLESVLTSFILF